MHKIGHPLSILLLVTCVASVALGQTQTQLQCEEAAASAYEYCLQHGIPCGPEQPNCGPHKGSPAQCLPAYSLAYQRCQPSFKWTQIPGPTSNSAWPVARASAAYWTDAQGNFWLFGGSQMPPYAFDDLWRYTPGGSPGTPGNWKLMEGSGQISTNPNTPSMPGSRSNAAFFVDGQGNVWLFGGIGFGVRQGKMAFGFLNDLWEYTPGAGGALGTWSLISGQGLVSQLGTNNQPSGRSNSACWVDSKGNFWLFGGVFGPGPIYLNDLWEYSPSANTWTLVSGGGAQTPAGTPAGRGGASYWSDGKGNVWIFGGFGSDASGIEGPLNDLWFFDSANSQWKLKKGFVTVAGSVGNYGRQAIPAASNVPPGRAQSAWWTDSQGNFWLFGGFGGFNSTNNLTWSPTYGPVLLPYLFNDLWEFKPDSETWIWISGSAGLGQTTPSPGARYGAAAWPGSFPNGWLFGGYGVDSPSAVANYLSTLWDGNGNVY